MRFSHDTRPSAFDSTGAHVPEVSDDDLTRAYLACWHLSTAEKLKVFAGVWLAVANQARTEALGEPGGFPAERARQVAMLQRFAEAIAAEEPDRETERLYHAGYVDTMLRRVRQQVDDVAARDPGDESMTR